MPKLLSKVTHKKRIMDDIKKEWEKANTIDSLSQYIFNKMSARYQTFLTALLEEVKLKDGIIENPNDEIFAQWDLGYSQALVEIRSIIQSAIDSLKK